MGIVSKVKAAVKKAVSKVKSVITKPAAPPTPTKPATSSKPASSITQYFKPSVVKPTNPIQTAINTKTSKGSSDGSSAAASGPSSPFGGSGNVGTPGGPETGGTWGNEPQGFVQKTMQGMNEAAANAPPAWETALGMVSGGTGGKAVKAAAPAAKKAVGKAVEIATKLAAKFDVTPKAVMRAAAGIRAKEAATILNTKTATLMQSALLKISKNAKWVAGALMGIASYEVFQTTMAYNVKDDQSRQFIIQAAAAEKRGDNQTLADLNEMSQELAESATLANNAMPWAFAKQTVKNIQQNAELIKGMNARMNQPLPADVEYEEAIKKKNAEQEIAAIDRQIAEIDDRNKDEAYYAQKRAENEAYQEAQRKADEEYYAQLELKRLRQRKADRQEAERYYELIRLQNEALLAEKRAEAEAYYTKIKEANELYWKKVKDESGSSKLGFGLLR